MKDFGTTGIENFVTLGSPHLPPPEIPGIFDQTGGILSFLEQEIPGTFHSDVLHKQTLYSDRVVRSIMLQSLGNISKALNGTTTLAHSPKRLRVKFTNRLSFRKDLNVEWVV